MAGYSRYAVLRMVPRNGPEESIDMMTAFTDAEGPVRIEESHALDRQRREDVNRRRQSRIFGFRWAARCLFQIIDMTDQYWIAQIITRSADPEWTFYLSVDGSVTEEEVEVSRYSGPDALGGKTVVGAEYSITFESVELLDSIPAIGGTATVPALYVPSAYTLPSADSTQRGRLLNYRQSNTPDQVVVCVGDGGSPETFSWEVWASTSP